MTLGIVQQQVDELPPLATDCLAKHEGQLAEAGMRKFLACWCNRADSGCTVHGEIRHRRVRCAGGPTNASADSNVVWLLENIPDN